MNTFTLAKIEFKKINIKNQLITLGIVNIIILLLSIMLEFLMQSSTPGEMYNINSFIVNNVDILSKAVFVVWESILIAKLIIEEYKNKTMLMLYTYPQNRKKILIAKIALIVSITMAFMVITQISLNMVFYLLSRFTPLINYTITMNLFTNVVITSISALSFCLITFCIGMIRKSVIATVLTSIVIVSTTISAQGSEGQLLKILPVAVSLGLVGIVATIITINRVLKEDLN